MLKTKPKRKRLCSWSNKMPISAKITLLYGFIFSSVIFCATSTFYANAYYFYFYASRQELRETILQIKSYLYEGGEITEEAFNHFNPNKSVRSHVVRLDNFSVEYTNLQEYVMTKVVPEWEKASPEQTNTYQILHGDQLLPPPMRKENRRFIYQPELITIDGSPYAILVTREYDSEQPILGLMMRIFIWTNIMSIFAVFLIGRFISKKMLKPIVEITKMAEKISVEDLNQRIAHDGPNDEVKRLAVTFNDMIERLEVSFQKQSQFISDASHELRTPISVIKGYANLMDRWGKSEPEILQESIDSIKSETEHMSKLVEKLLFLAKDEHNKKLVQKKKLELNFVVNEVIREFHVMEIEQNIHLTEDEPVMIFGDFHLIKQLLWCFIENSIKYSREDENDIHLQVYQTPKRACIKITDKGIGIPSEDIPLIFERFYRSDKSRSKEINGTGLGLSVASWIMEQHNAKATVTSQVGEGTEIVVEFENMKNQGVES